MPNQSVPLIVRKSDGGFGYDSTDLAAIYHRLQVMSCCTSFASFIAIAASQSPVCDLLLLSFVRRRH